MRSLTQQLHDFIAADGIAGRVTIAALRGSGPREAGAAMVVRADGRFSGTIGGGALEWQALGEIQRLMARHPAGHASEKRFALGPALGQCCGGDVTLRFDVLTAASLTTDTAFESAHAGAATPLLLFGAGHVGRALVLALAPLPFAIRWVDARREAFPAAIPGNVTCLQAEDPLEAFAGARAGTLVLAMTHSHALDLAICDAALRLPQIAFCGVIGSETKRARFLSQLRALGHDDAARARLICPIGMREIVSKEPAAIAAGVVVQLLLEQQRLASVSQPLDLRGQPASQPKQAARPPRRRMNL